MTESTVHHHSARSAALVAVSIYYIVPPGEKTRLGLDLQGGLEVVYQARRPTARRRPPTQMDKTHRHHRPSRQRPGRHRVPAAASGHDQISVACPASDSHRLSRHRQDGAARVLQGRRRSRAVGPGREPRRPALKQLARPGRLPGRDRPAACRGRRATTTRSSQQPGRTPTTTSTRVLFVYIRPPTMTGDAITSARAGFSGQTEPAQRHSWTSPTKAASSSKRSPASCTAPGSLKQRVADVRHRARRHDGVGPSDRLHRPDLRDGIRAAPRSAAAT